MNEQTAQRLVNLNNQFYQTFGEHFSATRQRIQPGVRKILSELKGDERILDLGCGNGEAARQLAKTPFTGEYHGLDFSLPLLKDAESNPAAFPFTFQEADLTQNEWPALLNGQFNLITCFAVLHHIPSEKMRLQILINVAKLLAPNGKFILSNWQFLNSPRLTARIQPWSKAGLSEQDVDENDYLLDWRAGGEGLRYAHYFNEDELKTLAEQSSFRVQESYYSDGENNRLGLYQVWTSSNHRVQ